MKKLINPVLIPIITIGVYAMFHAWFEQCLTTLVVRPFLSKAIIAGNPAATAGYLMLVACCLGWIGKRLSKGYRYSSSTLTWIYVFCGLYIYYRFFSQVWIFSSFWGNVKALDFLLLLPILFAFPAIRQFIKGQKKPEGKEKKRFLRDDPTVIDKEKDVYERHRFMSEIKERILHTPRGEEESSFCIGVVGSWGSGKTTFLKTLQKELSSSKQVIQFDFNPWSKAGSGNLTEAFFNEFSYQLSKHTDSLQEEVERYAKILVGANPSSMIARAVQHLFPSVRWEQTSAEAAKKRISNAMKSLHKKVVVHIDDIDRLDHQEISEVFKLIRNSAGFPDVIYVIAFDKLQVEAALKKDFELNNRKYLEKILQVEFYLPPPKPDIVFHSLVEGLEQRLTKEEAKFLRSVLFESDLFSQASLYWIKSYFHHQRDVVRFLNQFDFHYDFVKGEVYLPDFLGMMVLRFRYPDFTIHFYRNQFKYLEYKEEMYYALGGEGELILARTTRKANEEWQTVLKKALESGIPAAGIEAGDMEPLNILEYVFQGPETLPLSQSPIIRTGPKHHLSIRFSEFFSRYFELSLNGRLSDVEFDEGLYKPRTEFMKKVELWCSSKQLGQDLLSTLDRFTEYKDKDQFEKIISALVYIANASVDGQSFYIHPNSFLERFELRRRDNEKRLMNLYSSRQEIGGFLLGEISDNMVVDSWSYSIAEELSKSDEGAYPAERKAAAMLVARACEQYFMAPHGIDEKYGRYALDWENACSRAGLPSPNQQIRRVILANLRVSMPLFIGYCSQHYEEGRFLIRKDWVNAIFGDIGEFLAAVAIVNTEAGKELTDFYHVLEKVKAEGKDCAPYKFEVLETDRSYARRS